MLRIVVVGGTGFIGRRLVPLLAARGDGVTCMDLNPAAAGGAFEAFGDRVRVVRGDVTRFDEVMAVVAEAKPDRLVNLAYHIGSELPPRVATKLNVLGMDNCFEAARIAGVPHTVYASSLAVSGQQRHFGERALDEADLKHGDNQYAVNKIFNEFQAHDYTEKYGMTITGVRPANVTGPDKVSGSVDHVRCVTEPARGNAVGFPFRDAMRCPIHVDDIAEVFARVVAAEKPRHAIYNSGGQTISLGDLAGMVREFLPEARITFEQETGGRAASGNFLIDNTRLVEEFGVQYPPFRSRVLQIVNEVRAERGAAPVRAE